MAPARWNGALEVGDGWARWRGVAGDASLHAHSAAQAVLGPCEATDERGRAIAAERLLIEPMARHRLAAGAELDLVFVEPWAQPRALPAGIVDTLAALPLATPVLGGGLFWTAWRDAQARCAASDDAWSDGARTFVDERLADGPLRLDDLAAHLGLSTDRTRHRFAAAIGLPFKRYVLWRRLRLASLALQRGLDATDAAHESGFADSAHLARTLKAMFGVTITQALKTAT